MIDDEDNLLGEQSMLERLKIDTTSAAWYAGLGVMAAIEIIEWPVALAIVGTHALATRVHNKAVEEGVEAGE
jgi:hypothetical protein